MLRKPLTGTEHNIPTEDVHSKFKRVLYTRSHFFMKPSKQGFLRNEKSLYYDMSPNYPLTFIFKRVL